VFYWHRHGFASDRPSCARPVACASRACSAVLPEDGAVVMISPGSEMAPTPSEPTFFPKATGPTKQDALEAKCRTMVP
jgi:hypothetical protein